MDNTSLNVTIAQSYAREGDSSGSLIFSLGTIFWSERKVNQIDNCALYLGFCVFFCSWLYIWFIWEEIIWSKIWVPIFWSNCRWKNGWQLVGNIFGGKNWHGFVLMPIRVQIIVCPLFGAKKVTHWSLWCCTLVNCQSKQTERFVFQIVSYNIKAIY